MTPTASPKCADPAHSFKRSDLPGEIPTRFVWTCACGEYRLDMTFHGSFLPASPRGDE